MSTAGDTQHRLGPRSVGDCHLRQPRFEALNNLLRLTIIYATFGQQSPPGLRSRNRLPHHRLFAVPSSSIANGGRVGFESGKGPAHLQLRPGAVYFLPARWTYSFTFHPGLQLAGCHFDLEFFSGRDALPAGSLPQRLVLAAQQADEAWALGRRLGDLGGVARLRAWVLGCSGHLLDQDLDQLVSQIRAAERYAPLLSALEEARADLRIADLAPLVDLAPATLSRRFSADMGVPLKAFIQRRLAQRASEALLRSEATLRAIADDLGFSSEFYFSRFVKRQLGLSPSAYRRLADTHSHPQA